jgi:hypothetical protein
VGLKTKKQEETPMKFSYEDFKDYEDVRAKVKSSPKNGATAPIGGYEVGKPIIFDIILDITGSMEDYYDELVDCFNKIMIPALKGASERYKGPLRIGCMLFSEQMVPAWEGFKTLDELGAAPLKRKMLDQPGLQSWTALYGAMRAGVLWTAAAMEHMREVSEGEVVPQGKIIVLTDGANNKPPMSESAVSSAFESLGRIERRNLQALIGFFKTDQGLTKKQFDDMAKKTGFTGLGFYEITKGGKIEDRRKSFRHQFGIFSSASTK